MVVAGREARRDVDDVDEVVDPSINDHLIDPILLNDNFLRSQQPSLHIMSHHRQRRQPTSSLLMMNLSHSGAGGETTPMEHQQPQ